MDDSWNPTVDEVRAWAFAADSAWPEQDWDLALSWQGFDRLCIELAADDSCPKRRFFLGVLYLMVGDAVRTDYHVASRADVDSLLAFGAELGHPDVVRWRERSLRLIAEPSQFDYDAWCFGGLASEPSN